MDMLYFKAKSILKIWTSFVYRIQMLKKTFFRGLIWFLKTLKSNTSFYFILSKENHAKLELCWYWAFWVEIIWMPVVGHYYFSHISRIKSIVLSSSKKLWIMKMLAHRWNSFLAGLIVRKYNFCLSSCQVILLSL